MFCKECGTENRNDRKFCSNCGAPLTDYTKPRENLIMPEEIVKKQEAIVKKNSSSKVLNIAIGIILAIVIILTTITVFMSGKIKLTLAIISLVLLGSILVLEVVKIILRKKLQIKND